MKGDGECDTHDLCDILIRFCRSILYSIPSTMLSHIRCLSRSGLSFLWQCSIDGCGRNLYRNGISSIGAATSYDKSLRQQARTNIRMLGGRRYLSDCSASTKTCPKPKIQKFTAAVDKTSHPDHSGAFVDSAPWPPSPRIHLYCCHRYYSFPVDRYFAAHPQGEPSP